MTITWPYVERLTFGSTGRVRTWIGVRCTVWSCWTSARRRVSVRTARPVLSSEIKGHPPELTPSSLASAAGRYRRCASQRMYVLMLWFEYWIGSAILLRGVAASADVTAASTLAPAPKFSGVSVIGFPRYTTWIGCENAVSIFARAGSDESPPIGMPRTVTPGATNGVGVEAGAAAHAIPAATRRTKN